VWASITKSTARFRVSRKGKKIDQRILTEGKRISFRTGDWNVVIRRFSTRFKNLLAKGRTDAKNESRTGVAIRPLMRVAKGTVYSLENLLALVAALYFGVDIGTRKNVGI